MPAIYRASFGFLRRHPWQLGLAILGICIGVAVMVAVDLANQSSRKAFLMSMDTLNGQATHQIVAGPGGVDETIYTTLRVTHGIRRIAPIVSGYAHAGETALQLLGVDVFAEADFRQYTAPANFETDLAASPDTGPGQPEDMVRRFLTVNGSVLMSAATAAELALRPGDSFEILVNGKQRQAVLTGILRGNDGREVAGLVVTDIANAQYWLEMQGRLSRIDARVAANDEQRLSEIRRNLPPGTELLSASGRTETTAEMSDAFMTNLTAMSFLALLVGIFLIYNSVAFAVLQRRDLIGVLRALGVTRGQTFRIILSEAAVVGTLGSALGLLAGVWLGEKLLVLVARTLSDHYFAVNVTDIAISSASVVKGFVAGLGATLVAATVPAIEASSFQPRLALTRSSLEQRAGRIVPKLGFAGLGLMFLSALMLTLSGRSLVIGLIALFVLILGFAFCIPFLVRGISNALAPFAGRIGGTAGRLAIGGVGKTLSRTGIAIVALAIAVSATIGVSVMVESFRASVSDWLGSTLQSDVYVGVPRGSLDPDLIPDLTSLPGIAEYSTSRRAWLETDNGRTRILAIQMAPGSYAGTNIRDGDPEHVWRQFNQDSAVLVSDSYAYRHETQAGEFVTLNTPQGQVELRVAAVYQSYDSNDGAIMMSRNTYNRYFDDSAIDSIGLYLNDGFDADLVMNSLREVSEGRQSLIMNSNDNIRDISMAIFDRTFVITNVLYWLAVGVAIIGIFGAMLALQLERAREFGVLRALGMTPGQTGVLVSLQTAFIGFLAGLTAIPLGLVMAWVLVEVINRRAFGWQIDIAISAQPLLAAMVLAIGAALLAGIYPSWHAAHARPALAMREE
jgi:putative ABC transport system permease protein